MKIKDYLLNEARPTHQPTSEGGSITVNGEFWSWSYNDEEGCMVFMDPKGRKYIGDERKHYTQSQAKAWILKKQK
jgi:hypothetical protein